MHRPLYTHFKQNMDIYIYIYKNMYTTALGVLLHDYNDNSIHIMYVRIFIHAFVFVCIY